jgi:hypothetical protein
VGPAVVGRGDGAEALLSGGVPLFVKQDYEEWLQGDMRKGIVIGEIVDSGTQL